MISPIAFDIVRRLGTAHRLADGEIITDPDGIDAMQDDVYFIKQTFLHFKLSQFRDRDIDEAENEELNDISNFQLP